MNWRDNWGYKLIVLFLLAGLIVAVVVDFDKTVKEDDFKALEKAMVTLEERIAALEGPPTSGLDGNPKEGYQFDVD